MVAFGHTAIGATVGVLAYNSLGSNDPLTGIVVVGTAGFISHFIADFIPHGHLVNARYLKQKLGLILIGDVFLSIFLFLTTSYFIDGFSLRFFYIFIGIGASLFPDVLDVLMNIGKLPRKGILAFEHDIQDLAHWHGVGVKGLPLGWYDIIQFSAVIASFYIVIFL